MKLFLGLWPGPRPDQSRIFAEIDGKLVDLNLAHAAYLTQTQGAADAYDLAAFYFPQTIAAFLQLLPKGFRGGAQQAQAG